jgi:membrane protease YdiL (CAAX protease family)
VAWVTRTVPACGGVDPRIALGAGGLALAIALRVAVAGPAGAASIGAGLVFAAVVAAVAALTRSGRAAAAGSRPIVVGVLGALALCVPAALRHADGAVAAGSWSGYAPWALGVVAVAVAEEALLRGSLYAAIEQRAGAAAAIGATACAFAALHVPLYGWGAAPLDLAVGIWLGTLRAVSGSVTAPALAHAVADLAGWWLR